MRFAKRCVETDGGRVKHTSHLVLARRTAALVITVIQVALRQSELVAVFVNLPPVILATLRKVVALHNLFNSKHGYLSNPSERVFAAFTAESKESKKLQLFFSDRINIFVFAVEPIKKVLIVKNLSAIKHCGDIHPL